MVEREADPLVREGREASSVLTMVFDVASQCLLTRFDFNMGLELTGGLEDFMVIRRR